jgi:ferredoxin--NADP+ reductase
MMPKSTGTLVLDALKPGKRLFLLSSGTGFAPFASLIREPETYEKFETVIVTHTCRTIPELSYSQEVINESNNDEIIKEFISNKLISYHSTTRENFIHNGRITELLNTKKIFKDLEIEDISSSDRFMFCGSMGLNNDLKAIMIKHNLQEGANNNPAEFVLEKAFAG